VSGFAPEELTPETVRDAAPKAFAFACEQWSHVVERQQHALALIDKGLPCA
jgi:hypothetical protein